MKGRGFVVCDQKYSDALEQERKQLSVALNRLAVQEDRVTEAYVNEAMELDRSTTELGKLRGRRTAFSSGSRAVRYVYARRRPAPVHALSHRRTTPFGAHRGYRR